MYPFLSRFTIRSTFLFVILFAMTLPFPLHFFPDPGAFLQAIFQPLSHWTTANIFGLDSAVNMPLESDSLGLYVHTFNVLTIAVVLGLIWTSTLRNENETRLKYILNTSAAYILAFFLLKYGFDKVFKVQFYLPEPNTLYTPMGFLSKDILFWSTVGSSYSYSVFSGIIEVIPALLLFSRRTRLIGGLIAFAVMLHVLLINFSFDISVKLLSIYLLLLSFLVIVPYLKSLSTILLFRGTTFQRTEVERINRKKNKGMRFLKAATIACILFESLSFYVEKNQFNDDQVKRPPFHGAYQVYAEKKTDSDTLAAKSTYFGDLGKIKRVFIHRRGYFICQFHDDSMQDYQASLGTTGIKVKTNQGFVKVSILADSKTDSCCFIWKENGMEYRLSAFHLDLNNLPLLKQKFTWITD